MTDVADAAGAALADPLGGESADLQLPPANAFVEVPGLRGLRVATVGAAENRTLQVIEAVKDAVIPARTLDGREQGKVISGRLRFMRDGTATVLGPGDRWDIAAGQHQGPHVVLEDQTRALVLRDGDAALG